jgi:hypothetical protein
MLVFSENHGGVELPTPPLLSRLWEFGTPTTVPRVLDRSARDATPFCSSNESLTLSQRTALALCK